MSTPASLQPSLLDLDLATIAGRIDRAFDTFDRENPDVYRRLVRLTAQAHDRGQRRIGIGMLFEVIRWQQLLHTKDPDFRKLNNNFRSRYARKIMAEHPEFDGMFEVRELRS